MRDKRLLPPTSAGATAGAWGYIQPPQSGDSRTRRRPPCEPTLTLTLTLTLALALTLTLTLKPQSLTRSALADSTSSFAEDLRPRPGLPALAETR